MEEFALVVVHHLFQLCLRLQTTRCSCLRIHLFLLPHLTLVMATAVVFRVVAAVVRLVLVPLSPTTPQACRAIVSSSPVTAILPTCFQFHTTLLYLVICSCQSSLRRQTPPFRGSPQLSLDVFFSNTCFWLPLVQFLRALYDYRTEFSVFVQICTARANIDGGYTLF